MCQIWLRSDGRVEKGGGVQTDRQTDRQRKLQLYIVDIDVCASLRRGCKATTLRLFPPSHHGAIYLSMLLGVTIVEVGWVFYTEHHSLSTSRNFGQRHHLNALIYNYAATQFRPHYGCLSSTDRHHPVPTRSRSQRF